MTNEKNDPAAANSEVVEVVGNLRQNTELKINATSASPVDPYKELVSLEETLLRTVRAHCAMPGVGASDLRVGGLVERLSKASSAWHLEKGKRPADLKALEPYLVAEALLQVHDIRLIRWAGKGRSESSSNSFGPAAGKSSTFLAAYDASSGIYRQLATDGLLAALVEPLSPSMRDRDVQAVYDRLRRVAPVIDECASEWLIPMRNGVLDHRNKELLPHSPERPFTRVFAVDWREDPELPVIEMPNGEEWDPEEWMKSLSDDPEVVVLLWQLIAALFRPETLRGRIAAPYGQGNNGKGTLRAVLENLCGGPDYAPALSLEELGKDFHLSPVIGAVAILGDENNTNGHLKNAAKIKSLATGDTVTINRKGREPEQYRFLGLIFQPLNEFLTAADRTESFKRRFLYIPMLKNFTGTEVPEIKWDYLARDKVLEYIAWRALMLDHAVIVEPEATRALKREMSLNNNPVEAFWEEFDDRFVWDLLPCGFLYELYKSWLKRTAPKLDPMNQQPFSRNLYEIVARRGGCWEMTKFTKCSGRLQKIELLIAEYDLKEWSNSSYTGTDPYKRSQQYGLKDGYSGLVRIAPVQAGRTSDDAELDGEEVDDRTVLTA